jgi:aminoglycoside 2''-phosphotransferase
MSSAIADWRRIEEENPGLTVRSASMIGEGWTSRAYVVNDELVFRFPKRREDWDELEREIAFLGSAADDLPLAVPRYVHVAPDSLAATHGYAVYRYLSGHAMDTHVLTAETRSTAADAIARFLRALHTFEPSPEVAALLPREDERQVAEEYLRRAVQEIVPRLEPPAAQALVKRLEWFPNTQSNFSRTPVVLHADLSREHVLVDDHTVVAVIDFGDVNWGDPDYDFMYLFVDFGQPFVEDVARRYGHSNLEELRNKLDYFALVDQIDTIVNGGSRALEGQKELAWQRLRYLLDTERIR